MTHSEISKLGKDWAERHRFPLVFNEIKAWKSKEHPDVLGWNWKGDSCLLEAKTSRADFLQDKKKRARKFGGVGKFRYFILPEGLIDISELPKGWGLILVGPQGNAYCVKKSSVFRTSYRQELIMLISAARFKLKCDKGFND